MSDEKDKLDIVRQAVAGRGEVLAVGFGVGKNDYLAVVVVDRSAAGPGGKAEIVVWNVNLCDAVTAARAGAGTFGGLYHPYKDGTEKYTARTSAFAQFAARAARLLYIGQG